MATVAYNKRLAQERQLAAIAQKQAELSANLCELETTTASAFMTEDPNMATSAVSNLRVRAGPGFVVLGLTLRFFRVLNLVCGFEQMSADQSDNRDMASRQRSPMLGLQRDEDDPFRT